MRKKLKYTLFVLILLVCTAIIFCNFQVKRKTEQFLYDQIQSIPHNKVGLLLGTSKNLSNGRSNQYFTNRIKAAVALYQAGKIERIIISGDNGAKNYNEPQDMKEVLLLHGIPEDIIYLDYAGFRTFDSIIRCKEIFNQNKITVISQKFHNARAVFIARQYHIDAIGFNAENVNQYAGFKTNARELLARVKLFIDLFVIDKQPKFLGEKIEIH